MAPDGKLEELLGAWSENYKKWYTESRVVPASGLVECSAMQGDFVLRLSRRPGHEQRAFIYPATQYGVFPGTQVHLFVNNNRYSGVEGVVANEAIVNELKRSSRGDLAWSAWPGASQTSAEVYLDGFEAALLECEAFMRAHAGAQSS